jgi:hypothetical protein
MRVQTADDAKRWLANKSVAAEGTPEEALERALIAAVNDLAEATANLGA